MANLKAGASSEVRSGCLECRKSGFEYLQGWSFQSLSGQCVMKLDHPHRVGGPDMWSQCVSMLYQLLGSCLARCTPKQSCMHVIYSFLWGTNPSHIHSPFKGAFIHSPQYLRHANYPAANWGEIMDWNHGVSAGRKSLILTGNLWDVHVHILLPFVFLSIFPGSFWPKTEMVLYTPLLTCLGLKVRMLWVQWCRQEGYCTCKLHVLLLVVVSPAQTTLAAGPL